MEKKKLIIFTDIGDTVIDEGTEMRHGSSRVVQSADCIAGAKETFLELHARGYTVVLVADGLVRSFRNTMEQNGLDHIFADWIVSEEVGEHKPHARMFGTAMERLGLTDADKSRVIMVGNNLKRDIVGANRFGIGSVHFCWSPRYPHEASTPEEEPTYRIHDIRELLDLAERLEAELCAREERALIGRYQPRILMDRADPFPVRFLGCTVFREPGMSPSFRNLRLDPAALGAKYVIEYAVYFDYDIQHLYDLEHIWVMVADSGEVAECWCSYHGMRMRASGLKSFRLEGTHPVLYCQPGKHAFLPDPELFRLHCQYDTCCRETAGGGLLIPEMLRDRMATDERRNEKIRAYIRENFSFSPTEDYTPQTLEDGQFITWQELLDTIPRLVEAQLKIIES